jgi:hypothetical protein
MTAKLDLVVLVPGKDERQTFEGLLSTRCDSLCIRPPIFEIIVGSIGRDPGCYRRGPSILQQYVRRASHGLIVFDHEGSGQETRSADEVEAEVRRRLRDAGWNDRADVIVIRPELEAWVWSDSLHVDTVLGWNDRHLGFARLERPSHCMKQNVGVKIQHPNGLLSTVCCL